ncbi:ABC transporter permease [Flavobacterium sp. MXW15]|uniref:ABC transporter permease n=1 Tax=Xanthomonas chitinilytica TaxID=2989819 RepID=A0ABT3JTQ1_9XANT|nr:ABC transporter permease [Xanthomonas sp. H13-6]MCW4454313.1 ABC transporter permease [Flavobacterium sp. MXW15]MCW4471545.1 ABC transporter permease [Xanthomonas sp. H13-6]
MTIKIFSQLNLSLRRPEFWAYSSWLDIVTRYRRTRLGLVWLLAPVTVFMLITGPLYARMFNRDLASYMIHLGMGYAVWRLMVMVLNDSVGAFRSNKSFIQDGNTRLTDYTLKSIAKSLFYFAFSMIGMLGVLIWSPAVPAPAILTLFITIPIVLVNLLWVGYSLSILGARLPDLGEVLNTVLMVGFLFTPIIWEGNRYPPDSLGGLVVRLNPAFHMLEIVREPLFGRMPPNSSIVYVALLTLTGWLLAIFLCRRYSRYVPIWI